MHAAFCLARRTQASGVCPITGRSAEHTPNVAANTKPRKRRIEGQIACTHCSARFSYIERHWTLLLLTFNCLASPNDFAQPSTIVVQSLCLTVARSVKLTAPPFTLKLRLWISFHAATERDCMGFHSRLSNPYTESSDTSPFTMQTSRSVPSRTKPSFSSTRSDALLRVSAPD